MSQKIFRAIWLVALLVFLSATAVIIFTVCNHFSSEQAELLRNEVHLVAEGINSDGIEYLNRLDDVDFRLTWITEDGTIIYDNTVDSREMENHLEREEIREALEYGYGESTRYSNTLARKQIYIAERMENGSVIRLSTTTATIFDLFRQFILPLISVFVIALFLSLLLASRLSSRIVEPLNAVDLDNPLSNADKVEYQEIKPLLERLNDQHLQIERDKEELEKTSLIRQEFTANASHELKTPLHVISGYAELMESEMVPSADIPVFASKIRSEAQRMTKLVEDIIDLTQLDSGAIGMKRERLDLLRIAQNAVDTLGETAEENGVSLEIVGESVFILGISNVVYSVVYNLVINAIHYTDRGGHVRVSVEDKTNSAVLTVSDDGIGIPKEDQNRIFERFYRVDKSHSKEVGGTGLGLSIVKHALKIHNAKIELESEIGKGSVFTVYFPECADNFLN